jgi:hypothetical protein
MTWDSLDEIPDERCREGQGLCEDQGFKLHIVHYA